MGLEGTVLELSAGGIHWVAEQPLLHLLRRSGPAPPWLQQWQGPRGGGRWQGGCTASSSGGKSAWTRGEDGKIAYPCSSRRVV